MFKYFTATTILLLFTVSLIGQSPGGILTNNTLWLRSDNGITANGVNVTQWQEVSGANVTGNFNVQSLAGTSNVQTGPTLIAAGINFNPYLSFDGITNSLSSINNFAGTALVSNSNVTVFQVLNLKSGIVWLKWETDQLGTTGRLGFENMAGRLRFDFPKASPASAGQNVGVTNILNNHTLSTAYANTTTSVNRLNGADDNIISIPGPGNFGGVSTKIVIGNENLLNLPCKIDIAEVIIYSNTLAAAERNKIESYLAVKYGFTLNQLATNGNNYIASNTSITWDRALNSIYAKDITGIGRDDATALLQKQSKSVNTTALVTVYNGTYSSGGFPASNSSNTNTFSSDLSFLLVGDNGGTTSVNQCALDGNTHRMQRVWKASNIGSVLPVTISVDQASVSATVKNILVSSNPAFPVSATTIYPVTIANGKLFSAVTINHNEYFTFASDTTSLPQLQNITICSNTSGTITVINPAIGVVYNWYNQSAGGVLVGTGTSITLPNLQNDTTLYVATISVFNCTLPLRVPVTIYVQTVARPVVNIIQTSCTVNTGAITITAPIGTGYQYCINGINCQSALTFTNLLPGNYSITAINTQGCISEILGVTINTQPPTPTAPVINSPVLVCTNQTATLTINSPVVGNIYNWYTSLTGTVPVYTGNSYTSPPLSVSTTFYAEAVNIPACVSLKKSAYVLIRPKLLPPIVTAVTITDSTILFTWTAVLGATGYSVSTDGVNYTLPSSGANGLTHLVGGLLSQTTVKLYVKANDFLMACITSNDGTATGKTLQKFSDIYVPSAFTPNGDMINNTLKVFGDIRTYQFSVFNRFGQRIFYTTTINVGWDGTFKGKNQSAGTYVWHLFAKLFSGRDVRISGTTILLR